MGTLLAWVAIPLLTAINPFSKQALNVNVQENCCKGGLGRSRTCSSACCLGHRPVHIRQCPCQSSDHCEGDGRDDQAGGEYATSFEFHVEEFTIAVKYECRQGSDRRTLRSLDVGATRPRQCKWRAFQVYARCVYHDRWSWEQHRAC